MKLVYVSPYMYIHLEPMVPTGFKYTRVHRGFIDTTVTFEWDLPQDTGPGFAVDHYIISFLPRQLSHNTTSMIRITYPPYPWNITLDHNTTYTINVTAVNCVGESDPFIIDDIEFRIGKYCSVPQAQHNTHSHH